MSLARSKPRQFPITSSSFPTHFRFMMLINYSRGFVVPVVVVVVVVAVVAVVVVFPLLLPP